MTGKPNKPIKQRPKKQEIKSVGGGSNKHIKPRYVISTKGKPSWLTWCQNVNITRQLIAGAPSRQYTFSYIECEKCVRQIDG